MAHILIMPRQGNTVESCILVDWKVKEGDTVTEETPVCDVETDKAAFEVLAGASGTILKLLCAAGDDVPVLEPIAVIGAMGEKWERETGEREQGTELESKAKSQDAISPRARNLAAKEALPTETVPGSGPYGRIIERDIKAALENRSPQTAAAKAAASTAVPSLGTGIANRITTSDLASPIPDPRSSTPIKGIRKIIADRMHKSLTETAQFTLNACAPVSRLLDLRARMKNSADDSASGWCSGLSKITVNDLILFTVSRVLPRFNYMNAHKNGDTMTIFDQVHLGYAVDTPRGLMVPVIRNANQLSLVQIASEAKRLAAACQNSTVKPEELSGSTFTVTNLGSLGITSFTPVLHIPEVAILGVCNIELKPVGNRDQGITFESYIGFSLTINHQVVDGAPAARFLKALGEAVAEIDLLLIREGLCMMP